MTETIAPVKAEPAAIAREELYGMYEGKGGTCSPKCCTAEVKPGCMKDDLCIANGCCGMAPFCPMQYWKASCLGENTYCMWVYMSISIFTFTDKDHFEPAWCNCCDDGFVRMDVVMTEGTPLATDVKK